LRRLKLLRDKFDETKVIDKKTFTVLDSRMCLTLPPSPSFRASFAMIGSGEVDVCFPGG
jgi:hypothetical protein